LFLITIWAVAGTAGIAFCPVAGILACCICSWACWITVWTLAVSLGPGAAVDPVMVGWAEIARAGITICTVADGNTNRNSMSRISNTPTPPRT